MSLWSDTIINFQSVMITLFHRIVTGILLLPRQLLLLMMLLLMMMLMCVIHCN